MKQVMMLRRGSEPPITVRTYVELLDRLIEDGAVDAKFFADSDWKVVAVFHDGREVTYWVELVEDDE